VTELKTVKDIMMEIQLVGFKWLELLKLAIQQKEQ
jgi:hypothetical protein